MADLALIRQGLGASLFDAVIKTFQQEFNFLLNIFMQYFYVTSLGKYIISLDIFASTMIEQRRMKDVKEKCRKSSLRSKASTHISWVVMTYLDMTYIMWGTWDHRGFIHFHFPYVVIWDCST